MLKRVTSLLSLGLGVFILIQIVMPYLAFKLWEVSSYQENISLISPSPNSTPVLGIGVENKSSFPAFVSDSQRTTPTPYSEFTLSISSIKLKEAKVLVDSNDFEQSLALLPGTALPGERGNVFITGHSSLPQFFRPGNYKAIFANLPNIEKDDSIIIEAGEQQFKYKVIGLKVVNPEETWVINPPDNTGRYLSLMTCVPPGLYLKRLIVLAELE